MPSRAALTAAVVAALAVPAAAQAATITPSTTQDTLASGQCSLRQAIAAVNSPQSSVGTCARADAVGTTIALGSGHYTLSIAPTGADDNTTGDLNIGPLVSGLTIQGSGATIDATGLADRILSVAAGDGVTINGVTLTGGHAPTGAAGSGTSGAAGSAGANGGAIDNNGSLTLNGVTVSLSFAGNGGAGGFSTNPGFSGGAAGVGGNGGGIYNTGTLTLNSSTVSGDQAGNGGTGGMAADGPAGAGGAGGEGGGIYDTGTLTVSLSSVATDKGGSGGLPGANSPVSLLGVAGGIGGAGGGIYQSAGTLTLTGSTLSGDDAGNGAAGLAGVSAAEGGFGGAGGCGGNGGALAAYASATASPSAVISTSTLTGDQAGAGGNGGTGGIGEPGGNGGAGGCGGAGGGIYADAGTLSVTNSTITASYAGTGGTGAPAGTSDGALYGPTGGAGGSGGNGGALAENSGATQTLNATVYEDRVGAGGAGGAGGGAPPTGATGQSGASGANGQGGGAWAFTSSTCAQHHACGGVLLQNTIVASNGGGGCAGDVLDGLGNLGFGDTTCPGINADPKLGALANNGGPTQTMALGAGSAAIDAAPVAGCPATDQRGVPRPQGAACDIGAFEVVVPPVAPAGGVGGATVTVIAPALSHLVLSPSKFAAAAHGASTAAVKRTKPKPGGALTYTASRSESTTFVVLSPQAGVLSGKSCLKPSRSRHGRRCTRDVAVGSFTHTDVAGRNSFRFTGVVGGHGLPLGSYLLAATPRAQGLVGRTVTVSFKVVRK